MKKYGIAILMGLLCLFANAQSPLDSNIKLQYNNQALGTILNELEEQTGYQFSYGKINLKSKISFNFEGTLENGLTTMLASENLTYKIISDQIVLKYKKIKGRPLKGMIIDEHGEFPLIGANITVINSDPLRGSSTDVDGTFEITNLEVGRYDLYIEYLGYEPRTLKEVGITSGKESVLTIKLKESFFALEEIVVVANTDNTKALNDMATTSARSFSVEDSKRFAASISDPARMAQSFAGVFNGGDDLSNEIVIRGNSSRGLLWRLEGVEIPNPNHFSGLGGGGGSISMLSANTLSTSDFYTGAFPAEFGNATSGVFDLKMRNGNRDKREHTISIGLLGIEAATEGYFSRKSNASYLINYRYSTLELLSKFLDSIEGSIPAYQDFSFKVNVPTKKAGVFSIFGLGGANSSIAETPRDSTLWVTSGDREDFLEKQQLGVVGVTNRLLVTDNSYFQTSLSASTFRFQDLTHIIHPEDNYAKERVDETGFENYDIVGAIHFNHKFNVKHKIKTGFKVAHKIFDYRYENKLADSTWLNFFNNSGSTQVYHTYFQWKYRFAEKWEVNSGVNFAYLVLNDTYAIDPRIGLKWNYKNNQSFTLATGLYSRPEHTSTYFIERTTGTLGGADTITSPNRGLKMPKAVHLVGAYDINFSKNFRLKAEAYYQYLFDIAVSSNPESQFSVLNTNNVFSIIFSNDRIGGEMLSVGEAYNYGLELTLEKFFSDNYYFLCTASFFDSKYNTLKREFIPTIYSSNYIVNLLGGKEWNVGKGKKDIFGLNGRFTFNDGNRNSPIDLDASKLAGYTVAFPNSTNSIKLDPYFRFDIGVSYKINTANTTHTISLDVQNVMNRKNVQNQFYDPFSDGIIKEFQNGILPFLTYTLDFSFDKK